MNRKQPAVLFSRTYTLKSGKKTADAHTKYYLQDRFIEVFPALVYKDSNGTDGNTHTVCIE
ncbi:hypothetical protein ES703_122177 [subsurface metagenome]